MAKFTRIPSGFPLADFGILTKQADREILRLAVRVHRLLERGAFCTSLCTSRTDSKKTEKYGEQRPHVLAVKHTCHMEVAVDE